jgi:hypothetical protein
MSLSSLKKCQINDFQLPKSWNYKKKKKSFDHNAQFMSDYDSNFLYGSRGMPLN